MGPARHAPTEPAATTLFSPWIRRGVLESKDPECAFQGVWEKRLQGYSTSAARTPGVTPHSSPRAPRGHPPHLTTCPRGHPTLHTTCPPGSPHTPHHVPSTPGSEEAWMMRMLCAPMTPLAAPLWSPKQPPASSREPCHQEQQSP